MQESPREFVAEMSKQLRKNRIFIDYLRNSRGATSVAPYSTRATAGAPVSVPLTWDELGRTRSAVQFNVSNTLQRLRRRRRCPWEGFEESRGKVPVA